MTNGCVSYYQGAENGPGYVVVKIPDGSIAPDSPLSLVVDAAAQWCWNGSHVITNIWDTIVRSWDSGAGVCRNLGNFHWRVSGGIGNTWYTTHIYADWYCNYPGHGTHYHSVEFDWSHNGWGNSSASFATVRTWY